jgi:8-oxo-dGTP pyrophosphatase MutT (NUDIX family)
MESLKARIKKVLADRERKEIPSDAENPPLIRASVLVPIHTIDDEICLLLTKRTETVEHHKGQISFPGGMCDATDQDCRFTALREAEEEVGIQHADVEVLGIMDDMLTTTGFVVAPVIGCIPYPYPFRINADEVAELIHVPVSFFLNPRNERKEVWEYNGKQRTVLIYPFKDHVIWGATARIIKDFVEIIKEI